MSRREPVRASRTGAPSAARTAAVTHADVVVIGGGQAGSEVVQGLRKGGLGGSIRLVGDETPLPYERPPLSKGVLVGAVPLERLALRSEQVYADLAIDIDRGRRVVSLDPRAHLVTYDNGMTVRFGRSVLAMGARAVPSPWPSRGRIHAIRTFDDAQRLRAAVLGGAHTFLVVGGGFLGLEIASSLTNLGAEVSVVEAAGSVLPGKASAFTAQWLADRHLKQGLSLHLNCLVSELSEDEDQVNARLADGTVLRVDQVVYAAGAVPNNELALAAGARCGRGVFVDAQGRTSLPDVFAAGDVASLLTPGGHEARIESVNNAIEQARAVVATLLGRETVPGSVPTFWTEQVGIRLQQAGWVPPHITTHDLITEREETLLVERYVSGALVAIECVGRPVEYLRALRTLTDLRFRV